MSNEALPAYSSISITDDCQTWEHAGGETTPDEIAQYYRTAEYQALGYHAHPEKDTSVTIRVNLCDEDGDIVDTHAVVTVEIPADYSA